MKYILFIFLLYSISYAQRSQPIGGDELNPQPQPLPVNEIEKKVEDAKKEPLIIGNHLFERQRAFFRYKGKTYTIISDSAFADIMEAAAKDSATTASTYKILKHSVAVHVTSDTMAYRRKKILDAQAAEAVKPEIPPK